MLREQLGKADNQQKHDELLIEIGRLRQQLEAKE